MMCRIFSFLVLIFLLTDAEKAVAQHVVDNKRLRDWNAYCDKLKGIPSGRENYPALIKAARAGLKMTPSGNYLYKSIFSFHLGGGYESTHQVDSAIYYYEISKSFAEQAHSNSRIVFALRRLAGLYDGKQLSAAAEGVRNQLTNIAKVDLDQEIQVGANIVLGEYYFNAGMFEKALKCYLDYIKYLKMDYARTKNSASRSNIGVGYLAIGEIYQKLNRPFESLTYFTESLAYLSNYQEGEETAYKDLVTSYLSLNRFEEALLSYHKLKKSVLQSKDFTILVDAQVELGQAHLDRNDLKRAGDFLAEAGRNVVLSDDREDLYQWQVAMGDLSLKQNQSLKAIYYYKLALPGAIYFKNKASIASIYYALAEAERKNHLDNDAYVHILAYAKYTDSLKAESISKNIIEMEARFQNEVKADRIKILGQENATKNLQLKQEKRIRGLFAGAAALSLFALVLIFINYRNKRSANIALDRKNRELDQINEKLNVANQTKSQLFGMISHDLRGPVGQLFTFLKLQQKLSSEDERDKHRQELIRSSSNLLDTMEDLLLWSKSQMENFEPEFEELLLIDLFNSAIAFLSNQANARQVQVQVGNMDFDRVETDYNLLLMILRNLLQNAIQHSDDNGTVVIQTGFNQENQKFISVHNFGETIGEDQISQLLNSRKVKSKSSGYGLVMVQEMSEHIRAHLSIDSGVESGTTITLIFN